MSTIDFCSASLSLDELSHGPIGLLFDMTHCLSPCPCQQPEELVDLVTRQTNRFDLIAFHPPKGPAVAYIVPGISRILAAQHHLHLSGSSSTDRCLSHCQSALPPDASWPEASRCSTLSLRLLYPLAPFHLSNSSPITSYLHGAISTGGGNSSPTEMPSPPQSLPQFY